MERDFIDIRSSSEEDEEEKRFGDASNSEEADFALALSLQLEEQRRDRKEIVILEKAHFPDDHRYRESEEARNFEAGEADCSLFDPNPDIHSLFIQFNHQFFRGTLASVEVKWSKRMTLCAGLCCFERLGGHCSIKLSEPLLKFRPRSDLINTLLHEMIHAFLFLTDRNRDRESHGPKFLSIMNEINSKADTSISVYHSFHDEVEYHRRHWWKCNGPCVNHPPYFGIVKRAMNRPPSSRDFWFASHEKSCGGTFTKIKEPENAKSTQKRKRAGSKSGNAEKEASTASHRRIEDFFK